MTDPTDTAKEKKKAKRCRGCGEILEPEHELFEDAPDKCSACHQEDIQDALGYDKEVGS